MEKTFNQFVNRVADAILGRIGENKENTPTTSQEYPKYYTIMEVCKRLHISRATLYRHQKFGYMNPATYVGRKPLYTEQSINDYLSNFTSEKL